MGDLGTKNVVLSFKKDFLASFGPQKVQILVIGHPQITFGAFETKQFCRLFFQRFAVFGIFGLQKDANFGHWKPPNDFWEHLEQKAVTQMFFAIFCISWHFWPIKNTIFGHWTPPNDVWGHVDKNNFVSVFWAVFGIFGPQWLTLIDGRVAKYI